MDTNSADGVSKLKQLKVYKDGNSEEGYIISV